MIVEILMSLSATLGFIFWFLSKKINTIKTVGICKKNLDCSRGSKGMFEYEIDGIKHYNGENTTHLGTCKIGKKYTIYVKKYNHEIFVSRKVLIDLIFFIILFGIILMFDISVAVHETLH